MLYSFADCTLNADQRELRRNGDLIAVRPQVFDLLEFLIRNRERVVSKDDLIAAIWRGRIVSESALTTRINAVRCAIGDSGEEQRLIKTYPRKGIRFVGDVREELGSRPLHAATADSELRKPGLAYPNKPSIAVMPFTNMSGDPEQEYFADGMAEEITTALSRIRWLFVIARNSSFTYKGRTVDVRQVGRELGVRYVLEGSVRKVANRIRITGQLIDASTGVHLWADRVDGGLEDVFELQDQVTSSVVGAIAPALQQAEIERAKRKPTESLDAYDYYLRGMASVYRWTKESVSEALGLFCKAIELDPDFASAHGAAAWCYYWRKANGWMIDHEKEIAEATRLAGRAAERGKGDAVALSFAGLALGYVAGDAKAGAALVDRALLLNPNLADAWCGSGWLKAILGDPDVAIAHLARAMRLSPLDPLMFLMVSHTALAHFLAGRYDEACRWAERSYREQPHFLSTLRMAAASNALLGRLDEARKFIARALQLDPEMRISDLKKRFPSFRPEDLSRYVDALRKAGLPE